MVAEARSSRYEVWSRAEDGSAQLHGSAHGVTFQDACKHLASESVDFWNHFDKGRYRGRLLYSTEGEALAPEPQAQAGALAPAATSADER